MGTVSIRTDPDVERALQALTADGRSRSEVVRAAILAAERKQRREKLRAEAESLRDDPEDAAAAKELAAESWRWTADLASLRHVRDGRLSL